MPVLMGTHHGAFVACLIGEDWGPDYEPDNNKITGVECESFSNGYTIHLHGSSQFRQKAITHEEKHVSDFSGGAASALAMQGNTVGTQWLNNNSHMNTFVNDSLFTTIDSSLASYIDAELIGPLGNTTSWTEQRAYLADKQVAPHYFEH